MTNSNNIFFVCVETVYTTTLYTHVINSNTHYPVWQLALTLIIQCFTGIINCNAFECEQIRVI